MITSVLVIMPIDMPVIALAVILVIMLPVVLVITLHVVLVLPASRRRPRFIAATRMTVHAHISARSRERRS